MSSESYAVGRALGKGFKSFLLLLGISIVISFTIGPLQSSMVFLLLLPFILSLLTIVLYYVMLRTGIGGSGG